MENLTSNESNISAMILSKDINIICTVIVILIGLTGNFITMIVFSHAKFCKNSGHVYLLTMAIFDSLFLVVHFFEDTIRTYKDAILKGESNQLIDFLNLTDHNNFTCRLINYFRNVLRFISAYIVICFTIQRLDITRRPLATKFKSRRSACETVSVIVVTALVVNPWVLFMFCIQINEEGDEYCDINKSLKYEYLYINIAYTFFIMFVPMVIISICNWLIIYKTSKDEKARKTTLHAMNKSNNGTNLRHHEALSKTKIKTIKPHYLTEEQLIEKSLKVKTKNSLRKMTIQLMFISFSFVLFNLPYLLTWFAYFFAVAFRSKSDKELQDFLYEILQITEIFYMMTYSIKFYIYCATSSKFKSQLRYLSKKFLCLTSFFLNFS